MNLLNKFGTNTTAYAPIGAAKWTGNDLLENKVLISIAEKHKATVPQICLAWNLHRNVVVIPKSTNKERIKLNFEALTIKLDEDDMAQIKEINKNRRNFDPAKWEGDEFDWGASPIWS